MSDKDNILNRVIQQAVKGYKDYRIEPLLFSVEKTERQINRLEILKEIEPVGAWDFLEVVAVMDLNNDMLILTSHEVDIPISATLTLESLNNLYKTTRAEYSTASFFKHQIFSNYLKISLKNYGSYVPFQLEFLRVIPTL